MEQPRHPWRTDLVKAKIDRSKQVPRRSFLRSPGRSTKESTRLRSARRKPQRHSVRPAWYRSDGPPQRRRQALLHVLGPLALAAAAGPFAPPPARQSLRRRELGRARARVRRQKLWVSGVRISPPITLHRCMVKQAALHSFFLRGRAPNDPPPQNDPRSERPSPELPTRERPTPNYRRLGQLTLN